MNLRTLLLFQLLSLSLITLARAKDCLPDHSVCVGEMAYGFSEQGLQFGKVEEISGKAHNEIIISGNSFPARNVARTGRPACAKNGEQKSLCPGDPVKRVTEEGIVLGVFPTGQIVVAESEKAPFFADARDFELFQPAGDEILELRDAVAAISHIQNILNLPTPTKDCQDGGAHTLPTAPKAINCNEPPGTIGAEDSPRFEYFKNLLSRGASAPIKDFLRLWYPDRDKPTSENTYFFHCQSGENAGFDASVAGCEPDVLYSWGPREKVDNMLKAMPDSESWSGHPNPGFGSVWATVSPVSTYSYGQIPVRIRIKPDVHFVLSVLSNYDHDVGIFTGPLMDFIISDSSEVESWSYGTPEHYDEIVRDTLRIASGKRALTYYINPSGPRGTGMERVYNAGVHERGPQNEETLKLALLEMIRMILNHEGKISYAKGVCKNRAVHFHTNRPTYFNPE